MAYRLFIWHPDVGAKLARKPNLDTVKFGDGYEQSSPKGLNHNPRIWNCTFTRAAADAVAIENFLEELGGAAFEWVDPRNVRALYKCEEWDGTSQGQGGIYVVTAKFEQVFK